jgi:hypothetical protein
MAAVVHIKSGLPPESLKTNPLVIKKFSKIAEALKRDIGQDISERYLALITYKIKHFLEVCCMPIIRLPFAYFALGALW